MKHLIIALLHYLCGKMRMVFVGLRKTDVLYIQGGGKREPFLLPPFAGKDAKFLDGLLRAKEWFRRK